MASSSVSQWHCDVAVVGAGPVGIMTACLLRALHRDLVVKVFDKRLATTRDHALRIGTDSIDKIHALCKEMLVHSPASIDRPLMQQLLHTTRDWKKKHIRTSQIEGVLANLLDGKVGVYRGPEYEVTAGLFQNFLADTNARVVIGADGASDSQIREAIGAVKQEEAPLSYLLELKFNTTQDTLARDSFEGSSQAVVAEGWDFETMARREPSKPFKRATLHKFIDQETHRALLVAQANGTKGSTALPWTLGELDEYVEQNPRAQWVSQHIQRFFNGRNHFAERIVTFPMTMFRSSEVVKIVGDQVVVLAGDASAGVVLERGVNKGFIEAALCAKAVISHFERNPLKEPILAMPREFATYDQETSQLYQSEKKWAEWKAFGLRASEILLKIVVTPFKWVFRAVQWFRS